MFKGVKEEYKYETEKHVYSELIDILEYHKLDLETLMYRQIDLERHRKAPNLETIFA